MNQLKPMLNVDIAEDLAGGLHAALSQQWLSHNSRACIIITDAPCHGKQYHNLHEDITSPVLPNNPFDRFTKGDPKGLSIENIVVELARKRVQIFAVECDIQTQKMYNILDRAYNQV